MNLIERVADSDMVLVGIGEEFEAVENSLEAYNNLSKLLEGKNYFIVSLCMDDVIYDSNLDSERIVKPLGTYRKKQCIDACTEDLYDASETICPKCGKELVYNNITAENYVEAGYLPMWEKHKLWISGTLNRKLLLLELGVNLKFPQIIRWPFERLGMLNNKAFLYRVNEKFWQLPEDIGGKAEAVKSNSLEFLTTLNV